MSKTTKASVASLPNMRRAAGATFQPSLRLWQARYKAQKTAQVPAKGAPEADTSSVTTTPQSS